MKDNEALIVRENYSPSSNNTPKNSQRKEYSSPEFTIYNLDYQRPICESDGIAEVSEVNRDNSWI